MSVARQHCANGAIVDHARYRLRDVPQAVGPDAGADEVPRVVAVEPAVANHVGRDLARRRAAPQLVADLVGRGDRGLRARIVNVLGLQRSQERVVVGAGAVSSAAAAIRAASLGLGVMSSIVSVDGVVDTAFSQAQSG